MKTITVKDGDIVYINNDLQNEIVRLTECYIMQTKTEKDTMTFYLKELLDNPFVFSVKNVRLELLDISRTVENEEELMKQTMSNKLTTIYLRNLQDKLQKEGVSNIKLGDDVIITLVSSYLNNFIVVEILGEDFQIIEMSNNY